MSVVRRVWHASGGIAIRVLLISFLGVSLAACEPGPIAGQGYQLVFEDNFDGTEPDPSVWWSFTDRRSLPATIVNGALTVKTRAANNYEWGMVGSHGPRSSSEPNYPSPTTWQEGYFEARIRYTNNPWSWPAFWLFSHARTEAYPEQDCPPLTSEWDMMENGHKHGEPTSNSWYNTSLHRNTTGNIAGGYCGELDERRDFSKRFDGVDLSAWHVWSGRWTADELCTYLDGEQIQCVPPFDSTAQPMALRFSMQYLRQCTGCPPRPSEMSIQIDWVRVWQKP